MLLSVFFALMVGSDANGGTGQGGASPATSASSAEVVQDQRAADMITEAVDQVRSDWKKWAAGPYTVLLQTEAYKMNVAEWEIGMHEWLAVEDVSDEMLQQFMDTVGGDFTDKADLIRAMGVYHGRKHMRPDFDAGIFVKDAYAIVEADQTPDKQRIAELEAKLARATLEMEKAKARAAPALTDEEIAKMLGRALPYQWMTTLASAVAELQTRPLNAENWREDKFVLAVWNVLHQEILAKQNGRATVQQHNAQTPQTPKQQTGANGEGQAGQVLPVWRRRALGRGLRQEGVHWRFPADRRHQALGVGERSGVRHQQAAPHAVHKMWPYALVQGPLPGRGGPVKGRGGPGGPHWGPHSPRCMGGITACPEAHAHRLRVEHGSDSHPGHGTRVGGHVHQRAATSTAGQHTRRAPGGRRGEEAQCLGSQAKERVKRDSAHLRGATTGKATHHPSGGYRGPLDASQGDW